MGQEYAPNYVIAHARTWKSPCMEAMAFMALSLSNTYLYPYLSALSVPIVLTLSCVNDENHRVLQPIGGMKIEKLNVVQSCSMKIWN